MHKLKILWLSNKILTENDLAGSGGWLFTMAEGLVNSGEVSLCNISTGNVKEVQQKTNGIVQQWIIPVTKEQVIKGMPSQKTINVIIKIVEEFDPDLVHVWGTESFWGILTGKGLINRISLLEIQGLKFTIAKYYNGNLSFWDQISCIGFKEIFKRTTVFKNKRKFKEWGEVEKEIIFNHKFISTQSRWVKAQIHAINSTAKTFESKIILRSSFYEGDKWEYNENRIVIFSSAYPAPFKGLHIAVKAIALLKEKFPNIILEIIGDLKATGFKKDGYLSWVFNEIKRLNIESNIKWLGAFPANELVQKMIKCSAIVIPSFVESYCLTLDEAMVLGVPSVVSFTGGTSFLAKDEQSTLFFPPGDVAMCAYQLERLLSNKDLAKRISLESKKVSTSRGNKKKMVECQLEVYQQVIKKAQFLEGN